MSSPVTVNDQARMFLDAGGLQLQWASHEELPAETREKVGFSFETSRVCILNGRLYFILGAVSQMVFDAAPQTTCRSYSEGVLRDNPAGMISLIRPAAGTAQPPSSNAAWQVATRQAGFLAALGMFMVEGGSIMTPTMLEPRGKILLNSLGMPGSVDPEMLKRGLDLLERNPDGLPYRAFIFDGYANLPTGRTDALTIQLRCYGTRPFKALIVRSLSERQSSARLCDPHAPARQSSAPRELAPEFVRDFHAGVDSYKAKRFSWDGYFDPSV